MVQAHGRMKPALEAAPGNATSGPRAAIVLYPFTLQVKQDVANALLYHFVRYHAYLGFRVLQYTQARSSSRLPAPLLSAHWTVAWLVLASLQRRARPWLRASVQNTWLSEATQGMRLCSPESVG